MAASVSTDPEGVVVTSAPAVVSPRPAPKRHRVMPSLSTFQATKIAQLLHADALGEAQVEGRSSMPLSSGEITTSAVGGQSVSLADLISQASVLSVSSSMPPPLFTASVVITPSPVSMPLFSSSTPASIFDSPIGDFPVSEKEMPTTFAGGESTSAKETTVSDTGGSSGNFADDGVGLFNYLYLPTMCWDPTAQDKRYQPKWKIAESSRLDFSLVVHHRVERACPPTESAYVEGLDNEHLMNTTMVDAVSGPRRLAEIRRRWMHDNSELRQARMTIQELVDEKGRLESQLHAASVRESRFLSEKNKAENDLKRVTANLAEERVIWARDIAEKDRILSRAKVV
ncbi:hypothetical protein HanRHA438_Chr01g0020011 [Helianthus annuus]|uniref:Uncharacterized protein n=1 Tax=Helianthus annuus TaxID=4232 RepID=A0A9K3JWF1_HELAN|nr:hypothetical protein HanXRQr2_Chr01g0019461 [Helianthus annuus]KAJ0611444.1 hypothetical protein HanHA300_Chr01g0015861 [Helianthus annuus]KAJ0622492.1 hypothetical protein HanIR_Chr01g0021291 [Helianthus annuus]KAJ0626743.1 hypothetical protein HanHA89_Chr01g0017481 [Helianthus annuus]KAJ0783090.1 hypothetical protein HanLR1_Chr01g0016411 [Helianthus annuus]